MIEPDHTKRPIPCTVTRDDPVVPMFMLVVRLTPATSAVIDFVSED